jgi:pimeloyl-ACP methyl ester carboxylesterase
MAAATRLTTYAHDGLSFDARDEGPLGGEVVVLLHGFPQTSTSWAAVVPHLHAAGLRTLAPDQRGYSPGARPTRRRDYRLDRLVEDVVALVEALGEESVHVVGHDWGAAVAWSLAASRPDVVRTLTAVSVPHPRAMLQALRTPDQLRRSWYIGMFQLPVLPEQLLSGPFGDRFLGASGMSRELVARFRDEMVRTGALHHALGWYRAMPLSSPDGLGRRVKVPTTHVWSDGDTALGRRGAELTAGYVGGDYRLEVLPGSHWIPVEQPERLAEAILRRVAP